jgi:hypothetical protein
MYRPGRVLLYLLIAAHVAAAAALVALAFHSDLRTHSSNLEFSQRRFAIAAVLGASYAQTALAVWWTVMGRSLTWPTRAAGLIGVCTIWARVMAVSSEAPGVVGWGLYVGMTVAMLWVLVPWRMLSDRRAALQSRVTDATRFPGRGALQFRLREMMTVVFAAACTFAFLSWCVNAAGTYGLADVWSMSLCGAVIAMVTLGSCQRRRGMFWRSPAVIFTVATVTLLMWWQGGMGGWLYFATTFAVEAVTIAATMAVLHVAARQPVGSVVRSEPAHESASLRDPQFG